MIFNFIKYRILLDKNSLIKLPDVSEGIENKIYNSFIESYDMDSLIKSIKNKYFNNPLHKIIQLAINDILQNHYINLFIDKTNSRHHEFIGLMPDRF